MLLSENMIPELALGSLIYIYIAEEKVSVNFNECFVQLFKTKIMPTKCCYLCSFQLAEMEDFLQHDMLQWVKLLYM